MAVSSTNNSTALGTSSIDVAGIVEQLMSIENRPLEKIKSQIEQKKLVISAAKQTVGAFFEHGHHLGGRIDLYKLDFADIDLVVSRQGLEQASDRIAWRDCQRLALNVLGRAYAG